MQGNPMLRQFVNVVGGYRYHWHDGLEIQLIVTGECEICVDGAIHYLVPDDLILINAGCGHASLRHRGDCLSIVTHVSPDYLYQLGLDPDIVWLHCNSATDAMRNSPLFRLLRDKLCRCMLVLQSGDPSAAIAARGYFELFLAALIKNYPPRMLDRSQRKKDKEHQEQVLSVIKFIGRNYRKKLSLEEVARFAGYNRSYFSTFFKSAVAIGFQEYLTRYRLQRAITELVDSGKSIADIALDNGFSDVKAFNQAFQRIFRKSPNEYRKSMKHTVPELNVLTRKFAEENNPDVCSYLHQFNSEADHGNDGPTTKLMREMTFTLRADHAAADLLTRLAQAGITISLDRENMNNPK
jgi:AraC-like DNA-binding protein